MKKTKLGISIGLAGMLLYFAALAGMTPLIIAAGYVLICEENEWLKKTAVKAVLLSIVFTCLGIAFGILGNFNSFVSNIIVNLIPVTGNFFSWIARGISNLRSLADSLRNILFIILGLSALSGSEKSGGILSGMIKKHM